MKFKCPTHTDEELHQIHFYLMNKERYVKTKKKSGMTLKLKWLYCVKCDDFWKPQLTPRKI